jgi:hypothetical protein
MLMFLENSFKLLKMMNLGCLNLIFFSKKKENNAAGRRLPSRPTAKAGLACLRAPLPRAARLAQPSADADCREATIR